MIETIEKNDLRELQHHRSYPSISMLLPVYSSSPTDRQQTLVRAKNLAREVHERLEQEFSKQTVAAISDKIDNLISEIDVTKRAQGLALFINGTVSQLHYLPVPVQERTVIDETFATRDLVVAHARSPRYRVLSLSAKAAHIFEGQCDDLHEVKDACFPISRSVDGVETELPGNYGVELSALELREEKEFINRVEKALRDCCNNDSLPLVLAGVERTLNVFDETTQGRSGKLFNVIARVHGNFEHVNLKGLTDKVWPEVDAAMSQDRARTRTRLEEAVGPGRAAQGLLSVWEAAHQGRVDTLLLEEDYHQSVRINDSDNSRRAVQLVDFTDRSAPDVVDDAVDELVECVLNAAGDVVFFPGGELGKYGRIAAVLRY